MNKKAKNKLKDGEFQYGSVEMTDEEYQEAQNPKVRTTIFLDADLIRAYKKKASQKGMKYQQLIREQLKQGLSGASSIEKRLEKLEKRVFKKKTGT